MLRMAELALGARIPARLLRAVSRCRDDVSVARVGIHWATEQCRDLLDNGVVTVGGLGVEHRLGAVGEHRVIPVGGEKLALPGGCGGETGGDAVMIAGRGRRVVASAGAR